MKIWHEELIPKLPKRQLKILHKDCCKLRRIMTSAIFAAGLKKKLAGKNTKYILKESYEQLYAYHYKVMLELYGRDVKFDYSWFSMCYIGKKNEVLDINSARINSFSSKVVQKLLKSKIYEEHDIYYLDDCLEELWLRRVPVRGGYKNWQIAE